VGYLDGLFDGEDKLVGHLSALLSHPSLGN
jgi:hypothetical protein